MRGESGFEEGGRGEGGVSALHFQVIGACGQVGDIYPALVGARRLWFGQFLRLHDLACSTYNTEVDFCFFCQCVRYIEIFLGRIREHRHLPNHLIYRQFRHSGSQQGAIQHNIFVAGGVVVRF